MLVDEKGSGERKKIVSDGLYAGLIKTLVFKVNVVTEITGQRFRSYLCACWKGKGC
jgi:hypothetical protein